jgi:hypothetical protein
MGTRLVNVVIDSLRPRDAADFWAELLDWESVAGSTGAVGVRAPAKGGCELDLTFVPVPEVKAGKNRLHLDLASGSPSGQAATVDSAVVLGALPVDLGQGDVPWKVLADREGNEFCVLEPRPEYTTTELVAAIVVDAQDPLALATFWAEATGWVIGARAAEIVGLRSPAGRGPWLEFLRTPEAKRGKNRLHPHVAPPLGGDLDTEVDRLCRLGAKPADIGQLDVAWQVLADPEGNEFCVLPAAPK